MRAFEQRIRLKDVLIGLPCMTVLLVVIWPTGTHCGGAPPSSMCASRVKTMLVSSLIYANDFDDKIAPTFTWMNSLLPYIKSESEFHDTKAEAQFGYGYAMNDDSSGRKTEKVSKPDKFVLIFESSLPGRNAHGNLSTLQRPGRHGSGSVEGFLDGHAKAFEAR